MPVIPTGYVDLEQLASDVERAKQKLGPEVVRIKHTVGEDTSGEPSIHFRIVLTDQASARERLGEVAGEIQEILVNELRPIENWGLRYYFSFRSQSEHVKRNDAAWG